MTNFITTISNNQAACGIAAIVAIAVAVVICIALSRVQHEIHRRTL